jgi:hypothetical protein
MLRPFVKTSVVAISLLCGAVSTLIAGDESPIKSPEISADNSPRAIVAARAVGAATAAKDAREGRLRIIDYGEPDPVPLGPVIRVPERYDPETGYRILGITACEATARFRAEVAAYNEV